MLVAPFQHDLCLTSCAIFTARSTKTASTFQFQPTASATFTSSLNASRPTPGEPPSCTRRHPAPSANPAQPVTTRALLATDRALSSQLAAQTRSLRALVTRCGNVWRAQAFSFRTLTPIDTPRATPPAPPRPPRPQLPRIQKLRVPLLQLQPQSQQRLAPAPQRRKQLPKSPS